MLGTAVGRAREIEERRPAIVSREKAAEHRRGGQGRSKERPAMASRGPPALLPAGALELAENRGAVQAQPLGRLADRAEMRDGPLQILPLEG